MQPAFDTPSPWSSRPAGPTDPSAGTDASCAEPLAAKDRERIQTLFQSTSDLLATIAPDGRFTLLNPAWSETLGWPREDLLDRPLREFVHPDDVEQTAAMLLAGRDHAAQIANFTNRYRHRDGSWRWLLWSARSDGAVWYAAAKDVSDRIWLERQALHDPLTKLPNRLLLMDRARQALTRLHRSRGLVAILFIDLDRFKAVNDNLGHALGDHILISVSQRLAEMMRDSDTIARMGGDEFVILAEDLNSDGEALTVAERVLHALQAPFVVGSTEVSMLASVGVSVSHDPETDPETLLREADVAMYRAKRSGGYRLELFDEHLRREAEAHMDIERRLRDALPRDEMRLAYQPIFALHGGHAVACEALLRWEPGEGDPLKPAEFLERAQQSGLIVPIGEWVVDAACRQAAAWRQAGEQVAVSINVPARGLTEVDLLGRLSTALARYQLPPQALWIEVTEDSVLGDPERAIATLAQVRDCGIRVVLDRAGSQETRLALINALPLDALKLDRSLLGDAEHGTQARALAMALVVLARERDIDTVAVGVQSEAQLQLARELSCTHAQGFLLGEPQPGEQVALDGSGAVGSLARWGPLAHLQHRP
ncbi:MAG TPA: EAL domain-containing protein [Solirubrobacteraceae bacterium]|jgi:diguanylate cyclase (GGDEF)-like protein/PAS domain S-box-containing protein|nr:EAL domain-containing protein [Solirubrobacteraceae bacterium]